MCDFDKNFKKSKVWAYIENYAAKRENQKSKFSRIAKNWVEDAIAFSVKKKDKH